jgi:hypothetical protein
MSGAFLACPRCGLRTGATLGQMEALDGPTCPSCAARDGMSVPMSLASRPPDNNRLRPQPGVGRAAPVPAGRVEGPAA